MSSLNHWTSDQPEAFMDPETVVRDFDRVDYRHDWWHARTGDGCFCNLVPDEPPALS